MDNTVKDIERLKSEFAKCQKIFTALGDETRQQLIYIMLSGDCRGSRVIDISKKTHLSRPAVSHHMQILKNIGFVKARKEGTYIYYYLSPENSDIENMVQLFLDIKQIINNMPDRSGKNY
ncbi:MAG: ArsR/SmtB family transcription factor [Candidatus Ornithomonoglobus sp.]